MTRSDLQFGHQDVATVFRCQSWKAAVFALGWALGAASWAQAPDVGSAPPPPPLPFEDGLRVSLDAERLAAILATTASEAERARLAGGIGLLAIGAGLIPVGVIAQSSWNQGVGIALWFTGATYATTGAVTLIFPNNAETLAAGLLSEPQIPEVWLPRAVRALTEAAAKAESRRTVNGTIDLATGLVAVAAGAAGMATSTSSTSQGWGAAGVILGATLVGTGLGELFFPSATERALLLFREGGGTPPPVKLSFGATPLPGGGALAVGGRF
jgi:hypothetical protein